MGREKTIMNTAGTRNLTARILLIIGTVAMVAGILDPLEGSVIILAGGGLVALGTRLGNQGRA